MFAAFIVMYTFQQAERQVSLLEQINNKLEKLANMPMGNSADPTVATTPFPVNNSRELPAYYPQESLLAGVREHQIFTHTPAVSNTSSLTLVVFEDPLCSFCKALHNENLEPLFYQGTYSAPVTLIRRHFLVFGEESLKRALILECAGLVTGAKGYTAAHRAVYEAEENDLESIYKRLQEDIDPVSLEDIRACATDLGNPRNKVAIENIQKDQDIAIGFQFDGTPFVVANGIFVGGYLRQDDFVQVLEEIRTGKRRVDIDQQNNPGTTSLPDVSQSHRGARPHQTMSIDNGQPVTATITVFLDPLCPYCHSLIPEIETVKREYKDKNLVISYRHFVIFGNRSKPLAAIIECAGKLGGPQAYFKAWETSTNSDGNNVEAFARAVGAATGIDGESLMQCAQEQEVRDDIDKDSALARELGGDGTPYLVIDGQIVSGYRPANVLIRMISQ